MFNFIKRLEKMVHEVQLAEVRTTFIDNEVSFLKKKLSLLESQLDLTYIPASEEKKEARYEEKAEGLTLKFNPLSGGGHLCGKDCAVCRSVGPAGTSIGNPVGTRMSEWETSTRRPTQKIKKTKKN